MKSVLVSDKITTKELKLYDDINGLDVIEECLLFKGIEVAGASKIINIKHLESAAHILYGLKVNATNKLYVGFYLDRFYHRAGLLCDSGRVKVPIDIYNKVKDINDKYKNEHNKNI